ncbi:bifunctional pyr operon transcriptional regulator/uracil phosphoribosyltransferase PyrR [endosymbiont of unidentified scaly snail isolate Monju]|uniref:bifunctional pyr operon transcriptional regulator/uracil phosphoribosyltransferase PyrR n=1 Tax=endosymbiont of unidentified scaly snail isolate Monju TaxID=1248727 RepID=UPI0003891F05|nr:bifunctional pyr operon transcriptional regulator/uracil phosphoribosyltransferase PyrR [endosymbiont of unidentified scaly snail isolate Monju]BAN69770.1 pyrimidine operon attenuation protein/uracil phosphoribosyltransferase [endosymbiont of unidentified scaly snail isolate Monju]
MTEAPRHIFMQHDGIIDLIDGMTGILRHYLRDREIDDPAIIGIHTGGAWIAHELHQRLDCPGPLGLLDISFYRDDFTRIGVNPQVRPSRIEFDVDERNIVLVDDVIQSGRTIRAAMNEIFDFGRPASITLVTLIERNGRQLPIQPDVVGLSLPLPTHEHIRLTGPETYSLEISRRTDA